MPNRDTPPRLVEAWLDFHRQELCRDMDAVFAFDGHGMEIWCRSEENRTYRKLQKIIEPLRNSHKVELYLTRVPKNSKENEKILWTTIPPSLAENRELRSYMRVAGPGSQPRIVTFTDVDGNMHTYVLPDSPAITAANAAAADNVLRSRLSAWGNSVLRNNRIMRQYAVDIPELIRTAFEPAFDAALRGRARDICRKHAKDLVKSIRDLNKNLSRAFPKPSAKTAGNKKETKKEVPVFLTVVMEQADGIAAGTKVLSGRIFRFIYPTQHTVDLDDLKRPGLLASLDALETEAGDFEKALANLRLS
jgi:hypothetical protein